MRCFMDNSIIELKEEISILEERILSLEKIEKRRKAFNYTKILIKVLLFLGIIYGIWYGYNYVVNEIPHIMEEKIKEINPLKELNPLKK